MLGATVHASCETCLFLELGSPDNNEGECRRLPPQVYFIEDDDEGRFERGVHSAFPRVDKIFDWCGEHKEKPQPQHKHSGEG